MKGIVYFGEVYAEKAALNEDMEAAADIYKYSPKRLSSRDGNGTTTTHPHEIRNRIDAWGTRNHHSPGNWENGTISTDTWLSVIRWD